MSQPVTKSLVKHIAQLANIPISDQEESSLSDSFNETLQVIDDLQKIDVKGVEPTHQVTGLINITRPDKVDKKREFSQEQALANAKQTHNGYFVVPRVLENKDA